MALHLAEDLSAPIEVFRLLSFALEILIRHFDEGQTKTIRRTYCYVRTLPSASAAASTLFTVKARLDSKYVINKVLSAAWTTGIAPPSPLGKPGDDALLVEAILAFCIR